MGGAGVGPRPRSSWSSSCARRGCGHARGRGRGRRSRSWQRPAEILCHGGDQRCGGAGSALAAAGAGKRLLLANKESAVMAGALLIAAVQRSGAQLIPIDSEHNAIFQCLPPGFRAGHGARRRPRGCC